jgi:phosphate transport system protein
MCGLAGVAMMDRATQALLQADLAIADQVITDHDRVVQMRTQAEETSVVLAKHTVLQGILAPRRW